MSRIHRAPRAYVPLDAAFFDDDKVIVAGEAAAYLYLNMLARIRQLDTDGVISEIQMPRLGVANWRKRLAKLVEVGLIVQRGSDYIVPTWCVWNETVEQREARLRADRERKSKDSGRNPNGIQAEFRPDSTVRERDKRDKGRNAGGSASGATPTPPPIALVLADLERKVAND